MNYIEERQRALKESGAHIFTNILTGIDAASDFSYLANQLAFRENQIFERLYTPMQYEQFLPITDEVGPYATEVVYEIIDKKGTAGPHVGRSGIPEVEIGTEYRRFPVLCGSVGYAFTQEELRQTVHLKRPIPERKLGVAMEAYRRHMNKVGLFGEENTELTGLYNNPIVPKITSAKQWEEASVDQILGDINTLISTVWENTAYNDIVDTIVMAPKAYSIIAARARSEHSDLTVLRFVEQNNFAKTTYGYDVTIRPGFGLDIGGTDGARRMIGYVKSEQRLVMHIPLPLQFLAPQSDGLKIFVPGEYKYSGVEFRYPNSACYMDGI